MLQFLILPKWNLPEVLSGLQVDGIECAPWWSNSRITILGEEFIVTGESGPVAPGAPAHSPKNGEKPSNVKRKVVKSDGGKKVMIIETTIDSESEDK